TPDLAARRLIGCWSAAGGVQHIVNRRGRLYNSTFGLASPRETALRPLAAPSTEHLLRLGDLLRLLLRNHWILEITSREAVDDGGGDDDTRKPFVIRRHDVPGCLGSRGSPDHVFICFLILVPVLALFHVGGRELPILFGPVQALEKSLLLFLPRHVEKELANQRAVSGQIALEIADVPAAVLPQALRLQQFGRHFLMLQELAMHAHHDQLLVVGAVEDANPPTLRERLGAPPEVVVIDVFGGR